MAIRLPNQAPAAAPVEERELPAWAENAPGALMAAGGLTGGVIGGATGAAGGFVAGSEVPVAGNLLGMGFGGVRGAKVGSMAGSGIGAATGALIREGVRSAGHYPGAAQDPYEFTGRVLSSGVNAAVLDGLLNWLVIPGMNWMGKRAISAMMGVPVEQVGLMIKYGITLSTGPQKAAMQAAIESKFGKGAAQFFQSVAERSASSLAFANSLAKGEGIPAAKLAAERARGAAYLGQGGMEKAVALLNQSSAEAADILAKAEAANPGQAPIREVIGRATEATRRQMGRRTVAPTEVDKAITEAATRIGEDPRNYVHPDLPPGVAPGSAEAVEAAGLPSQGTMQTLQRIFQGANEESSQAHLAALGYTRPDVGSKLASNVALEARQAMIDRVGANLGPEAAARLEGILGRQSDLIRLRTAMTPGSAEEIANQSVQHQMVGARRAIEKQIGPFAFGAAAGTMGHNMGMNAIPAAELALGTTLATQPYSLSLLGNLSQYPLLQQGLLRSYEAGQSPDFLSTNPLKVPMLGRLGLGDE